MATPDTARPEAGANASDRAWLSLLGQASRQSVSLHFDAYADIDWDSPDMALDPEDPRWELAADDPLGGTAWYRDLPAATRARLGCELVASKMKTGLVFESVLKRGLLEFASTLPNGAPEFRYAYHEIIEEAQHSLMFQEFVNRSGFDAAGLHPVHRFGSRRIVRLGRRFPQLFFLFVLGGEDPINYVQRRELRSGRELTRCSSGSCASTSPRKPVIFPSPGTTSSTPSPACPGVSVSGWPSPPRSSSARWRR